jgi:hypothetical protein
MCEEIRREGEGVGIWIKVRESQRREKKIMRAERYIEILALFLSFLSPASHTLSPFFFSR